MLRQNPKGSMLTFLGIFTRNQLGAINKPHFLSADHGQKVALIFPWK